LERYHSGVNRQLAVLATGLGKTCIAAALRSHHGFTKKVMFLVHYETLAQQAADKMASWNPGLMVGVEMAGRKSAPMDVFIVASVPTIGRAGSKRIKQFDPASFDCIIQDEAHIGVADTFRRVYDHFGLMQPNSSGPLFLGITATPNRTDGRGLRELFDEIIFDMGIQQGIASGYLCDLVGYRVSTGTNLDGVKVQAGDFAQGELSDEVNTSRRNGLIVKEWYAKAFPRRTIVFTVDVQHALDLAEAFKAHGVPAAALWGDDPDRAAKMKQHRSGELMVLCNCAVLGIGYDDPDIQCIVSAAPTKSTLRYVQQVGRGTRISEGKQDCIVLDVVDNSQRHSLVNISSLLGLPKDLDLKGERYTVAQAKLERVAKDFPSANLHDITSLKDIDSIAERIAMFTVKYPAEVERLTELAWRKQGDGYILPVRRDKLTLCRDLRDEWWVRGSLNGKAVEIHAQNLAGAFNAADREVLSSAGDNRVLVKRDARWHGERPTPKQIELCRKLGLKIPAGANRGQVSAALDVHFGRSATA
jgi:ATP-dependent helicase IRC3